MTNQSEIKNIKKSIHIPTNVYVFSTIVIVVLVAVIMVPSLITNVDYLNAIATTIVVVPMLRWAEQGEKIQEIEIIKMLNKEKKPRILKSKLNLNSLILGAAIGIGYCYSHNLPNYVGETLSYGLRIIFIYKLYAGILSRYRYKLLISTKQN